MKEIFIDLIKSKRGVYLLSTIVLILFSVAINIAFGAFTNRTVKNAANITVNNMHYSMTLNGNQGTVIKVPGRSTPATNVGISSLNKINSKYELIYKVCSDSNCTSFIEKPDFLLVEYSSRTIDSVAGTITSSGSKSIRLIATNNSDNNIYIKLDMNAGYTHNTLDLLGLIKTEYNEEDITIAAYIDGELQMAFPTTNKYNVNVDCTVNNNPTTASGEARWDGTKWVVDIVNATTSKTYCNVSFTPFTYLRNAILAQGGGAAAIEAKGSPNFAVAATAVDSGLYAAPDEYGTSYYYRGIKDLLKNNVIFGGYQWKIIRINGDGTIRLIYNGECPNNVCIINSISETQLTGYHIWDTNAFDSKQGALKYSLGGNDVYSSAIQKVNNWYDNLEQYKDKIADNLFCNEAFAYVNTYYPAYNRLSNDKKPTLKCAKNYSYTVNASTIGNGELSVPVGMISADEVAMAGIVAELRNETNYLYSNQAYWTLTPAMFMSGEVMMYSFSTFYLVDEYASSEIGIRPVISLTSNAIVNGSGSQSDPYIVE